MTPSIKSYAEYKQRLLELPHLGRVAVCCGSVEHTLPLFEHFRKSLAPRVALDYAWECTFGRSASNIELERLDREAAAVIPHIDVDASPEAELSMRSAVGVLETLDCLMGSADAAVRACSGVLDTLVVAIEYVDDDDALRDSRLFEAIEAGRRVPSVVSEELALQEAMMDAVVRWTDGRLGLAWREEHRRRGVAILHYFAGRFGQK